MLERSKVEFGRRRKTNPKRWTKKHKLTSNPINFSKQFKTMVNSQVLPSQSSNSSNIFMSGKCTRYSNLTREGSFCRTLFLASITCNSLGFYFHSRQSFDWWIQHTTKMSTLVQLPNTSSTSDSTLAMGKLFQALIIPQKQMPLHVKSSF